MTNLEKYEYAFTSNLKVSKEELVGLKYQGIFEWDSVGHMDIIADLEEAYDIQMDAKDVLDLDVYEKGFTILSENYGVNFDE